MYLTYIYQNSITKYESVIAKYDKKYNKLHRKFLTNCGSLIQACRQVFSKEFVNKLKPPKKYDKVSGNTKQET